MRLLLGVLSALFVSDWHAVASSRHGVSLKESPHACHRALKRVLSAHEERQCKLDNAPAHPAHTLPDVMHAQRVDRDDEEFAQWNQGQTRVFATLTEHSTIIASTPVVPAPETQLERPPRA